MPLMSLDVFYSPEAGRIRNNSDQAKSLGTIKRLPEQNKELYSLPLLSSLSISAHQHAKPNEMHTML